MIQVKEEGEFPQSGRVGMTEVDSESMNEVYRVNREAGSDE